MVGTSRRDARTARSTPSLLQNTLRHVQRSSHRIGECPCDAHGITLLQPRDGFSHLRSEYAVNGAAVITQPTQRRLHGADISGLHNKLLVGLEVLTPQPLVAGGKVGVVQSFSLMGKPPLVALCQRID